MSAEAILLAIEQESQREVDTILADARQRADRLLADARATADGRVSDALAAADPLLCADAARRVNAARLRLLHARAERRAANVALAFDEARTALALLPAEDPERWQSAMERLADATCREAGPGARLEHDAGGQLRAISADGRVVVDGSPTRRLERAATLLVDEVAEALASAEPEMAEALVSAEPEPPVAIGSERHADA
jgi:hypothetical protein